MNPLQGRFLRTLAFLGLLRVGPILGINLRLLCHIVESLFLPKFSLPLVQLSDIAVV